MKTCRKCSELKPLDAFEVGRHQCRNCRNLYRKSLDTRRGAGLRDYLLKKKYKISAEDYDKMNSDQGGVCKICKLSNVNFWGTKLAVDHDHKTGKVRGLLCDKCNKGLGQFDDDTDRLLAAIAYLKE